MIFICVGSREYQFDRLIRKIDELVGSGQIEDKVFGQIGQSNFLPKNFQYKRFISNEEFVHYQNEADIIISHGGTGALIGALKLGKQVIAVPRLKKFNEHTDDHQVEVASVLSTENYLVSVTNIDELLDAILSVQKTPKSRVYDRKSEVFEIVRDYIENSD